jgi:hypothetical protein
VHLDGEGRNSPFTAALLKHMEMSGREISSRAMSALDAVDGSATGA